MLAMVRPGMSASAAPTLANTSSRSPGVVKPLLALADGGAEVFCCALDASVGTFIAPEVSGRFRSGGTSSGRASGASA